VKRARLPLVYARWLDASHPAGEWQSVGDENGRDMAMEACGICVHVDDDQVVIAAAAESRRHRAQQFTAEICIPAACVTDFRVLMRPG
jgi:hypothetical protein